MIANINLNLQELLHQQILPKVHPMNFEHELLMLQTQLKQSLPLLQNLDSSILMYNKSSENFSHDFIHQEENKEFKSILSTSSLYVKSEFKLEFCKPIETPIFKGKYFSFKICLKQLGDVVYPISESLEIEVLVFNQDDVLISKNMRGQEILKGNTIQNMHFNKSEHCHSASFKIQITEVSSHFLGKSLNLKIRTRRSDFLLATGWKIKPICIDNLIVKAKKTCTN